MTNVQSFTFSPFQENTYVISDESGACVVVDPGCYDAEEQQALVGYITREGLSPKYLLNTHAHVDHVFGNRFVAGHFNIPLALNALDLPLLQNVTQHALAFGVHAEASPEPTIGLKEGDKITFGNTILEVICIPGHSPGSVGFVNRADKWVLGGDVLFSGSIGRTDLPGGDFDTLIRSVRTKLFPLGDDFTVYSGHGPATTIGQERKYNPFLREG